MQKKELEKVREFCIPLSKHDYIKAVWLYGSAIRTGFVKGHDIDVMIILDDTKDIKQEEIEKLDLLIRLIEEKSKSKNLMLHFQNPKPLTLWWDLIRKGEPWAITSLRNIEIIYDPSRYIALMHKLLKKGELYSREERAEKLIERAREKLIDVRNILLDKIPYELLYAATEAAQTALIYAGFFPPTPRDVLTKLMILERQKMLEGHYIDIYEEILLLIEKIEKGTLGEFTGKEIESWLLKIKSFILKMEEILLKLEKQEREKNMLLAYQESISLCEKALQSKYKKIPETDAEKIRLFKKEFVDTGKIGKTHYFTLAELYAYHRNKKARKELEKEKYLDKTYIKSLELAISEVIRK
ncbi:nucleotidyltransferase domain-containing protein [Candidatus Pacearchaeota archaeon]|nr:nucleotidyltransferase domain-containing protein [Candidatus Pacearchaeota archaeon]